MNHPALRYPNDICERYINLCITTSRKFPFRVYSVLKNFQTSLTTTMMEIFDKMVASELPCNVAKKMKNNGPNEHFRKPGRRR